VLLEELLNELPPRRKVDHQIEVIPWMGPSGKGTFLLVLTDQMLQGVGVLTGNLKLMGSGGHI
jgi:hypothetical protein